MSSTFPNPSIIQTSFRQQYTNGGNVGVIQYDTGPQNSTFASPANTNDLRQWQEDVLVPVSTTPTIIAPPGTWTVLTKLTIINLDTNNGLRVILTNTNGGTTGFGLPPNGGLLTLDLWPLDSTTGTATYGYNLNGIGSTIVSVVGIAASTTSPNPSYQTSARIIFCGYT